MVGAALTPEPPVSKGFTIERAYYTLDGKPVDLKSATGGSSQVKQNERFVVVVKVSSPDTGGRILLVDRLPAGLEIENPRIVDSGDIKSLSWLKTTVQPEHTDFRDARFVAAFDFFGSSRGPAGQQRGERRSAVVGHGRLRGAGGDAGLVRASGGDGGGHVPARPLRAHGVGSPRGYGARVTRQGDAAASRPRLRRNASGGSPSRRRGALARALRWAGLAALLRRLARLWRRSG